MNQHGSPSKLIDQQQENDVDMELPSLQSSSYDEE